MTKQFRTGRRKLRVAERASNFPRCRASDVRVATSTIRGAGQGLFALRTFDRGTRLPAPYKGRPLTRKQFERLRDFRWCFEVANAAVWAVDAKAVKEGNPC